MLNRHADNPDPRMHFWRGEHYLGNMAHLFAHLVVIDEDNKATCIVVDEAESFVGRVRGYDGATFKWTKLSSFLRELEYKPSALARTTGI